MPTVSEARDPRAWNSFLAAQTFRPFLQSWEMGEVYRDIGQKPVRLEVREGNELIGICFGHIVPARRGRHLSIPYGPILRDKRLAGSGQQVPQTLIVELERIAKKSGCSFIRMSPFTPKISHFPPVLSIVEGLPASRSALPAPLHLLAEHIWYLPLVDPDPWDIKNPKYETRNPKRTEEIFKNMRATTRNLIRRAEKEGVTITASDDPLRDLPIFLKLHDETRHRHRFTPYTDAFFRAQIKHFSKRATSNEPTSQQTPSCSLYLARYHDEIIASSIHVHFAGETSYHHGASTERCRNIPASYLLQWHAIQDALAREDHIYNFWGIAPPQSTPEGQGIFLQEKQPQGSPEIPLSPCKKNPCPSKHPFAGVTIFKTGFGGNLLELTHCMDLPLRPSYYLTRGFEIFRKWRRGF